MVSAREPVWLRAMALHPALQRVAAAHFAHGPASSADLRRKRGNDSGSRQMAGRGRRRTLSSTNREPRERQGRTSPLARTADDAAAGGASVPDLPEIAQLRRHREVAEVVHGHEFEASPEIVHPMRDAVGEPFVLLPRHQQVVREAFAALVGHLDLPDDARVQGGESLRRRLPERTIG